MGDEGIDNSVAPGDRVILLKNLHRPLEEHWAGNKKVDAVGSDYSFKHHITRLEKMYTTNDKPRIDMGPPQAIANVSPQTQLYGRGGIAPVLSEEALERRRNGWDKYMKVDTPPLNHGKVSAIQEKRVPPPAPRPQSRSRSPSQKSHHHHNHHHLSSSGYGHQPRTKQNRHKKIAGTADNKQKGEGRRSKNSLCRDPYLSREEVVLRGRYRFETQEEELAYNNFVAMLRSRDAVDKLKIIQDAFSDAESASLLSFFGGAG